MEKVYVVMGGCVGDEHICSMWSTEEKANAEIKRMKNNKWDKQLEPWLEEWEVK